MKSGCSVFLAAFVALGASWYGFVYGSLKQLGVEQQTVILQSSDNWPQQRTGEATLGLQVYRKYGCAACHTEQVRQTGVANELVITSIGAHKPEELTGLVKSLLAAVELKDYSNTVTGNLDKWNGQLPVTLYFGPDFTPVGALVEKLKPVKDIKTDPRVVSLGADIAHGWGVRQSVAADYLYDQPVQLGSLRAGPDLAMVGVRKPALSWQLQHLYAPTSVNPKSTMPAFRFLFEVRKIGDKPSPDALALPKELAPAEGMEVVPTDEARQLAAYLLTLKANAPLYEAPFTPVTAAK